MQTSRPTPCFIAMSEAIRRIATLPPILGGNIIAAPRIGRQTPSCSGVLAWGCKPSALRAEGFAASQGFPLLRIEDGFLRSVYPGVLGDAPLSLVLDDLGMYYDATRPSRLEVMLEHEVFTPDEAARAERAITAILKHKLSKYNHVVPTLLPLGVLFGTPRRPSRSPRPRVLVIDQTRGDVSVAKGQATLESFTQMLAAALTENPRADILIKTHPDVIAGKKQGYLTEDLPNRARIQVLRRDVNPIALLQHVDKVYTVTSQMGFEALMLGKPVVCFGTPFYAGWGLTDDRGAPCPRRTAKRSVTDLFIAAYLRYTRYLNPDTGEAGTLEDVIRFLVRQQHIAVAQPGQIFAIGFPLWKRATIRTFLSTPASRVQFARSFAHAQRLGLTRGTTALLWGAATPKGVEEARQCGIQIARMEDGFIRSSGLGSNLAPPLSLAVDGRGIYFDPRTESDLSWLLGHHDFTDAERQRARQLMEVLTRESVTKYNLQENPADCPFFQEGARIILVAGQVENDASIRLGCTEVRTNEALLRAVRSDQPLAHIMYRPHPDVLAGNRKGDVGEDVLYELSVRDVRRYPLSSVLALADEIQVMTSTLGFEALMRGKRVVTWGLPFYAGWGLTEDKQAIRFRGRKLALEDLVYASLVLYPRYRVPGLPGFATPEAAIAEIVRRRSAAPCRTDGWLSRKIHKLRGLWQCIAG